MTGHPTMYSRPPYAIDSVDNALRVLHMLRDEGSVRVTSVAEHLHIATSSAHRLMAMLVYHGFALQDDSRRYLAGPALSAPVLASGHTKLMIDLARPVLQQLCDEIDETVNLTSRVGVHARVLLSIETTALLRIGDRTGSVLPAHATAGGRALLAVETTALVERLYRGKGAESYGPPLSDDEFARLSTELEATRRRGYALCDEETQIGVAALAVPILSSTGRPLTTITVSTPSSRLQSLYTDPKRLGEVLRAQRRLAAVIDLAFREFEQ